MERHHNCRTQKVLQKRAPSLLQPQQQSPAPVACAYKEGIPSPEQTGTLLEPSDKIRYASKTVPQFKHYKVYSINEILIATSEPDAGLVYLDK